MPTVPEQVTVTVHQELDGRDENAVPTTPIAVARAGLSQLCERTMGSPDVLVALLDGVVHFAHPGLRNATLIDGGNARARDTNSYSARHGTFVAGLLGGVRDERTFGICPRSPLLVVPIFTEVGSPAVSPGQCADAVYTAISAGAQVINISAAYAAPSVNESRELQHVLDLAARRSVLVVVAAGNQAMVGSSALVRHHAVIPVVAVGNDGTAPVGSTVSASVGRRGLAAPGVGITGLESDGSTCEWSGTSVATPFVTGTIALLLSLFPRASPAAVRQALRAPLVGTGGVRGRASIIPPVLNAESSYASLAASEG